MSPTSCFFVDCDCLPLKDGVVVILLLVLVVIVAWPRVVVFGWLVVGNTLDDVPYVLSCVAEFTTCYASTERETADRNCVVFEGISKVIIAFSHGANEDTDALFGPKSLDIVLDAYYGTLKGESHLSAVWWEMFRDRVLDHAEKFFLRSCRTNRHAMKKLNHETSESLECTRDADRWVDFDEDAPGGVDIDLKFAGLVDGRVEEGKKTLVELVWSWFLH